MGNFGLNRSLPWLQNTDGAICFIYKRNIESATHLFLDCFYFRNKFESLWNKLKFKIAGSNPTDRVHICNFHRKFRWTQQDSFTLGRGGSLSFHNETNILINRLIS